MFRGFTISELRLIVALLAMLGGGWVLYHWLAEDPAPETRLYGAAAHHPPGELVLESGGGRGAAEPSRLAEGGRIELNRATAEDLELLPGIGPVRAAAILAHRERTGGFADLEALEEVHGIGPATLERLRPYLEVGHVPEGIRLSPPIATREAFRPVHVNRADAKELQRLPGVGPAISRRILEERRRGGPFRSIEGMQRVSGIGPRFVERNRELIRLD